MNNSKDMCGSIVQVSKLQSEDMGLPLLSYPIELKFNIYE